MIEENKIYETLALGIYHRFKREENYDSKSENPIMFEYFVAKVIESCIGGKATVTEPSGDFGVDIIHVLPNRDTFLAQVKCYKLEDKIKYDPISILHSNIIKRNAQGGYFVTTSDYNDNAKKYAEGLNIRLINGSELAQYWLKAKSGWIDYNEPKTFLDDLFDGLDKLFKQFFKIGS